MPSGNKISYNRDSVRPDSIVTHCVAAPLMSASYRRERQVLCTGFYEMYFCHIKLVHLSKILDQRFAS